jgi:hypothetical protein
MFKNCMISRIKMFRKNFEEIIRNIKYNTGTLI